MTDVAVSGTIEPCCEETGFAGGDRKQYTLQLTGFLTLNQLHRLVSDRLKDGLDYKDDGCKMLAMAIFAAATHPRLCYAEIGGDEPLWVAKLRELGFKVSLL